MAENHEQGSRQSDSTLFLPLGFVIYSVRTVDTTRSTLLERVKLRTDRSAWKEFFDLYWPMLVGFARQRGLKLADAEDVAQECMDILSRTLPKFDYSREKGAFKNYLYTIIVRKVSNRLREKHPRSAASSELRAAVAPKSQSSAEWDKHWVRRHVEFGLERLEGEFAESTMAAFKLYALKDWPVDRVCEALSLTANQVYLAKSRVTARLREELAGWVGYAV